MFSVFGFNTDRRVWKFRMFLTRVSHPFQKVLYLGNSAYCSYTSIKFSTLEFIRGIFHIILYEKNSKRDFFGTVAKITQKRAFEKRLVAKIIFLEIKYYYVRTHFLSKYQSRKLEFVPNGSFTKQDSHSCKYCVQPFLIQIR